MSFNIIDHAKTCYCRHCGKRIHRRYILCTKCRRGTQCSICKAQLTPLADDHDRSSSFEITKCDSCQGMTDFTCPCCEKTIIVETSSYYDKYGLRYDDQRCPDCENLRKGVQNLYRGTVDKDRVSDKHNAKITYSTRKHFHSGYCSAPEDIGSKSGDDETFVFPLPNEIDNDSGCSLLDNEMAMSLYKKDSDGMGCCGTTYEIKHAKIISGSDYSSDSNSDSGYGS